MALVRFDSLVWGVSVFIYLALTASIAITFTWLFNQQRKSWLLRHVPGPKTLPIFGSIYRLGKEDHMDRLIKYSKMGTVVKYWIDRNPTCMITTAKGAEAILTSVKHLDKGDTYDFLRDWLGDGLLTATGSRWHAHRKLLTPAFHFKILEDFLDAFNKHSNILVKRLQEKADGKAFDTIPYITYCTLDIICETAMGRTVNAQGNADSEYVRALHRIGRLLLVRSLTPWLRPNWLYNFTSQSKEYEACLKVLHDMSRETINERKRIVRKSKIDVQEEKSAVFGQKRRLAFLDLLLEYSEDGAKLSDEDIREEVDTFMFEGHDTTTAAINWTLYLLGHNPQIQAQIHEEMDSIFGESDRQVTMEDIRSMKLLENCIKETLRIYPSVHKFLRALKEELMIGDYLIPSGTNIMVFTYAIHRDPEQFPDPEKFDPDRFLPENVKHRHPYAYIPFSAGPRNCIGQKFAMMEEKVLLSSILRKFRVESTVPREKLKMIDQMVLRPKGGNIMRLYRRQPY